MDFKKKGIYLLSIFKIKLSSFLLLHHVSILEIIVIWLIAFFASAIWVTATILRVVILSNVCSLALIPVCSLILIPFVILTLICITLLSYLPLLRRRLLSLNTLLLFYHWLR